MSKRKTLLTILSITALATMARAGDKWNREELWDLFNSGRWNAVKAAIIKNPKLINQHDPDDQMTPLHGAARFGPPELVLFFIQKGADVNAVEYNNFTPLHDATTAANVKVLIEHGADTTKKDAWGNTPLQKAAEQFFNRPADTASLALCNAMLEAGAKLDILSALYLGKRDEVKRMIAADPTLVREHMGSDDLWRNTTPLGVAAAQGDNELVELFLKDGALVDGPTDRPLMGPITPLLNAIGGKHYDTVEILLKAGASLEIRFQNRTVLQIVDNGTDEKMKELCHRYAEARAKQ